LSAHFEKIHFEVIDVPQASHLWQLPLNTDFEHERHLPPLRA
jgi:hypothetical protein